MHPDPDDLGDDAASFTHLYEVGSSIEYSVLQPETRQAWLRAAAVMIEPFVE